MPLAAGVRVGPFEIEARLDLPGLGEVYRAHDHEHDRQVAIQVIRADFGRDPDLRARFERDIGAAASYSYPGVVEIYDVGIDGGAAYVVSEPLIGQTLRARLDRRGLSVRDAVRCAAVIGRARLALWRRGIGHPGVSADRVFLAADGRVLLLGGGLQGVASSVPSAQRRWARPVMAGALVLIAFGVLLSLLFSRDSRSSSPASADLSPVPAASAPPVVEEAVPAGSPASPVVLETAAPPVPSAREPETVRGTVELPPLPVALPVPPPPPAAADRPPAPRPSSRPAIAPGAESGRAIPRRALPADGREPAALVTEAGVRSTEFDLDGAFDLLTAAAARGDADANVAALYIGGILAARQSFLHGGSAESLTPVHDAITALAEISRGRPGGAEIARLMLHAAAAAAQSEREEMRLYIETATQMELLQQAAGFEGAPLVSAAELAGELWLQVHHYDEAQRAFTEAAARRGANLRILAGLARATRRLGDAAAACSAYRTLAEAWNRRPALPVEIAEARAYLGGCAQ